MFNAPRVDVGLASRAGRPVVIKRALDEAGERQLDREAQRLTAATHPGVVELLERDEASLTLAWAGDQTLETVRPGLAEAAGLLTVLAETVADLHDLGVIHGRLTADHVVIGAEGRPRLCGLRGIEPEEASAGPADDVAALGRLLDLVVGTGTEAEPIPDRRWGRRRWTGYQRRALQTLADQATDPNPDHRPRARELAAALAQAVPDAHLAAPAATTLDVADGLQVPAAVLVDADASEADAAEAEVAEAAAGAHDADPSWDAAETFLGMRLAHEVDVDVAERPGDAASAGVPAARGRPVAAARGPAPVRRAVVIVGSLLLVVLAITVLRPSRSAPDRAMVADTAATVPARSATTAAGTTATTTTAEMASTQGTKRRVDPRCAAVAAPSADVDGDGCPDAVGVTGSRIQAGAVRYQLGTVGDDVTVGDWDCDGQATPALVRPSTGEVFVFTRWARVEEPLSLGPTAVVPDAVAAVPVASCGPLRVRSTSGTITTVPVAPR